MTPAADGTPVLVLLNGPPASGKSTIARRFIADRPLALNLDIDVVRGLLGDWLDDPITSGLVARTLAVAMIRTHLTAGRDVIVPQFLARAEFIDELAEVAEGSEARFVEAALWLDRQAAIEAFARRRAAPTFPEHHDAAALVDRSGEPDPIGARYDAFAALMQERPLTKRVEVVVDDVGETYARLLGVLG